MSRADFYCAYVQEPRYVLGFRLRPLSIGHLIILNRVGSPFISDGEPGVSDLAAAVAICSMSYREGLDFIDAPDRDRFMHEWHQAISGNDNWKVRLKLKKPNVVDFTEHFQAFGSYLKENSKIPNYSYSVDDLKELECPSEQVVKVTLMRDLHMPEAELLDRSWTACLWDFITLKALAGHVRMYDEEGQYAGALKEAAENAAKLRQMLMAKGVQCQS